MTGLRGFCSVWPVKGDLKIKARVVRDRDGDGYRFSTATTRLATSTWVHHRCHNDIGASAVHSLIVFNPVNIPNSEIHKGNSSQVGRVLMRSGTEAY